MASNAAVVQLPEPQAQAVERAIPRLAYTRKRGWVVVTPTADHLIKGFVHWQTRPGGAFLPQSEILAWADLPPVPENAA